MKRITVFLFLILSTIGVGQVTKSAVSGIVQAPNGNWVSGAAISLVHQPTGTQYFTQSDLAGRYALQAIKTGGPYEVLVTAPGFKTAKITNLYASLGNEVAVTIVLENSNTLDEVVVKTSKGSDLFSKTKTGASQQFSNREILAIPISGSRSIQAITKYNANQGYAGSFGGQDSRLNNFTIDGSVFNNGFGLGTDAQAGGRTGSTAISLDAIEQLQVNVAPFDIRQSGFLGAAINAVTKSGTNQIEGAAYTATRSNQKNFVGSQAAGKAVVVGDFQEKIYGARLGMPLVKNKLFFFGNLETVTNTAPATTWTATGSAQPSSQLARTTATDLQKVSDLLQKLGYTTGPWEGFEAKTLSQKFLMRLDWSLSHKHQLSLRYVHHNSNADQLVSNSSYAGAGSRVALPTAMAFKNGGYTMQDNTRSVVLEVDSRFSNQISNSFIAGFDKQIESRGMQGAVFPTIDILEGGATYISAGLDPFTKGNNLSYATLHFTNNLTLLRGKHTLVVGANYDYFKSENQFIVANNGSFVFNSLSDFENTINESIALNGAETINNKPAWVQYNYYLSPNPVQTFKSNKLDIYGQDCFKPNNRFAITLGLRLSRVWFGNTGVANKFLTGYTDNDGKTIAPLSFADGQQFDSAQMPKGHFLFEPRLGFNYDPSSNHTTQLRGGTGIFTGRPPYVILSNAIANSGALSNGFADYSNTTRGFLVDPTASTNFTPTNPESSAKFQLSVTDPNYNFPQVWKTNLALDQKLPFGFTGTIEGIYTQNKNAIHYYNANLEKPLGTYAGTDNRLIYAGTTNQLRVQDNISGAYVLTNNNLGYFYSTTFKLEYPFHNGLWGSLAYTNSVAYNDAASLGTKDDLVLSQSSNSTPHRLVGLVGYKREYGGKFGGATSINIGYIGEKSGSFSYFVSGDLNRDGVYDNDFVYVPMSASELRFAPLTVTNILDGKAVATTYSETDQQKAFDRYIDQDAYLSTRRGNYAQKNAATLPMLHRLDLSVIQDFYIKVGNSKNSFQIRADILNFTNLLNNSWGQSQRVVNTQVLNNFSYDAANNIPIYKLATQTLANGSKILLKDTFEYNASVFDVWQAQLSLRYTFGY